MGDESSLFITKLIAQAKEVFSVWAPREIVYGIQHAVSVANVRGCAQIVGAHKAATASRSVGAW